MKEKKIGGDLNGYVGRDSRNYERLQGGYDFGD